MSDKDKIISWNERLLHACHHDAETIEKEHEHFRKEANAAPLNELELFLSMPPGKYGKTGRAVMAQVYRERVHKIQNDETLRENRANWWRGLAQQVSAQIIGTLLMGFIFGFITGIWFSK
jgi:hypothetical protein